MVRFLGLKVADPLTGVAFGVYVIGVRPGPICVPLRQPSMCRASSSLSRLRRSPCTLPWFSYHPPCTLVEINFLSKSSSYRTQRLPILRCGISLSLVISQSFRGEMVRTWAVSFGLSNPSFSLASFCSSVSAFIIRLLRVSTVYGIRK